MVDGRKCGRRSEWPLMFGESMHKTANVVKGRERFCVYNFVLV